MTNILQAYGLTSSLLKVSEQLLNLNIGHSIVTKNGSVVNEQFYHLGLTQPAWPILVGGLHLINKIPNRLDEPRILFVCDSLSAIELCNIQQIDSLDLKNTLRKALVYALSNTLGLAWKLTSKEPSIEEYVNSVSKPQILNEIQTQIYKISPYSLRKEVQNLIISYLAGAIPQTKLMLSLSTNYKLLPLLDICLTDRASNLRLAVAAFTKLGNVEQISSEYGIASFQILYIVRSFALSKQI